jgi:hypothetical protein
MKGGLLMSYQVDDSALRSYCQLFSKDIERNIQQLCFSDYTLKLKDYDVAYHFFDDSIIKITVQDNTVSNIQSLTYDEFAPVELIQQFMLLSDPPKRLERYLKLGEERFRVEIKEALQSSQFVPLINNSHVWVWSEYDISLAINNDSFTHLLLANL